MGEVTEIRVERRTQGYVNYVQEEYRTNTARQRICYIDNLEDYFVDRGLTLDLDHPFEATDNLKQFLHDAGLNNPKVSTIRNFLKYIKREPDVTTRDEDKIDQILSLIKYSKLSNQATGSSPGGTIDRQAVKNKLFTDDELSRIRSTADQFQRLCFEALIDSGCRPGELAAIHPKDINYDVPNEGIGATYHVDKKYVQNVGVEDLPKTQAGNRTVNFRPETADRLQEWIEDRNIGDDDLVFTDYRTIYTALKDLFVEADIRTFEEDGSRKTEVTPHWVRHNTCTRLIRQGYSKEEVQEYMGHSSVEITEVYEHFRGDEVQDVVVEV